MKLCSKPVVELKVVDVCRALQISELNTAHAKVFGRHSTNTLDRMNNSTISSIRNRLHDLDNDLYDICQGLASTTINKVKLS